MQTKQLTVIFDTLAYSKKLETAGLTTSVAQAQAEALAEIFSTATTDLATKFDLRDLEHRLTIKLGGFVGLGVAALAALMSFLIHTS